VWQHAIISTTSVLKERREFDTDGVNVISSAAEMMLVICNDILGKGLPSSYPGAE
jgi:hypothetical protein